jgi:hypothetical protein
VADDLVKAIGMARANPVSSPFQNNRLLKTLCFNWKYGNWLPGNFQYLAGSSFYFSHTLSAMTAGAIDQGQSKALNC